MPINPKYAEVVERNKKAQGGDYEKLPFIWMNNPGDQFFGTAIRVSDIMQVDSKFDEGKKVDVQYIDYKDVTLRKLDPNVGDFVEEKFEKATFKLEKGGHFDALVAALMEAEQSDPPIGWTHRWRRLANDDKRHTFGAKFENNAPF